MFRSILSSSIAILSICSMLFGQSEALPHRQERKRPVLSTRVLQGYTVPLSNGTASLPAPPSTLSLKAITIGRGTQNYTCADSSSSTKPVLVGAVATLFDASPLLPYLPPDQGQKILNLLPSYLLMLPSSTLETSSLVVAGQHFFSDAGVPIFDLLKSGSGLLVASKAGDILAPPGSPVGQNNVGNGAVDWLSLDSKDGSSGLSEGYRVYTAGGKAPASCDGQASHIEVQYAAQYWFYG